MTYPRTEVVYRRLPAGSEQVIVDPVKGATVQPADWDPTDDNVEYEVWIRTHLSASNIHNSNKTTVTLRSAADGGTVTTVTGNGTNGTNGVQYRVHTFTGNGDLVMRYPRNVDYLIVGGGGGGGSRHAGGGGAGGVRAGTSSAVPNGTYPVVVGAGGAGKAAWTLNGTDTAAAASGGASSWNSISAAGGGRGGSGGTGGTEEAGGSGGGSSFATGAAGNTPSTSPSQGNAGGNGSNNNWSGGGGGGAGAVGGNSVPTGAVSGGNGGNGLASSITGSSVTYAGGGGGSMESAWSGTAGQGGTGGGGAGGHLGWEMFNTRGILRWELYNTGSDGTPANSAVLDSMLTSGRLSASGFASIGTSNRNENVSTASSTLLDWSDATQLATATGATVPNSGDNFALVVSGSFVAAETGTYTFKIQADDSFDFYLNNDRIVSYYGYSEPAVEGTANLNSGQRYDFRVRVHEQGGGERLRMFWKSPGNSTWRQEGGQLGPASPQTAAEMNSLMSIVTRTTSGTSSLFNSSTSPPGTPPYDILNWIDAATPTGATVPNSGNDFGFQVSGTFVPSETGTYTFTVAGDDAVDVLIGDTVVTSHYGSHAMGSLGVNTGTISLTAGQKYRFRARQQDGGGNQGLSVFWRKPSQIASSYWWRDTTELSPNGRDGVDGLGGGGGGGGFADTANMAGGRGGNGLVVLRYPVRVTAGS